MEALPYYKWLWRDWRANRRVQRMSWQARGLYRELLDEFWAEGSIPEDLKELADICGCTVQEMEQYWPEISPCWDRVDQGLSNHKLNQQRTEKDAERIRRKSAGRSGGLASNSYTRGKQKEASAETETASPDIAGAEQEHKQSRLTPAEAVELPEWLTTENWVSYQKVRKAKKTSFVDDDAKRKWIRSMQKHYDQGRDVAEMLDQMIANNWVGPVDEKWKMRKREYVPAFVWDDIGAKPA